MKNESKTKHYRSFSSTQACTLEGVFAKAVAEKAHRIGLMDVAPGGRDDDVAVNTWAAALGVADVAPDRVLSVQAVTLTA